MSWVEGHPDYFESYDLRRLRIDQAIVGFKLNAAVPLWVYELSSNCLSCPYGVKLAPALANSTEYIQIVDTSYPIKYRFRTSGDATYVPGEDDLAKFCDVDFTFHEFGVYEIQVDGTASTPECTVEVLLDPVNIYLPILIMFFIFGLLCLIIKSFSHCQKILPLRVKKYLEQWAVSTSLFCPAPPRSGRLVSLDVFRGICVIVMLFVNDGGASYNIFQYSTWDGLSLADLIFPWFLWIMGVCIPMSLRSQYKSTGDVRKMAKKILVRSVKLLFLGLMLGTVGNVARDLSYFRFLGVLQRFSVSYIVCSGLALICLINRLRTQDEIYFRRNSDAGYNITGKLYLILKDIVLLWRGWVVVLALVALKLLLIFLLPVPGCPTGYLGPGGLHNNGKHSVSCVGGAAGYIDRKIWGSSHLFLSPLVNEVYNHGEGPSFDPEGVLGYMTSIFQVWSGVQLGVTLLEFTEWKDFLPRMGIWSAIYGLVGGLLCGWQQTGGWIPVNKNLWSLSFVLVASCFALAIQASLYIVCDAMRLWNGSPFVELGMNSILVYASSLIVQQMMPWHWSILRMDTHFAQLIESIWGVFLWVLLAICLHRREKYYKI